MRNCVIGVLGSVIQKALTGEDLTDEQKEQRDECLNTLEEHILDCNAHVRSKVLQMWQRLCCNGAVPLARYGKLLAASALRLEDKSAIVRKQALQLLRTMLQSNPFAAKVYVLQKLKVSFLLTDLLMYSFIAVDFCRTLRFVGKRKSKITRIASSNCKH